MTKFGHTISWPDERWLDRKRTKYASLVDRTIDWGLQWLALLAGSLLVALIACTQTVVSNTLSSWRLGHCSGIWYASKAVCCMNKSQCDEWTDWTLQWPIYVAGSTILGLAAFAVVSLYPNTAMSGIPELKVFFSGYTMPDLLGRGPLLSKTVALLLAIASGLWVGFEGPLVHLATLSTNCFIEQLKLKSSEAQKRDLLMASAAGGLCLAFNAPLAGVLFVFEVFKISDRSVLWRGFVCATVASFVYESIDPAHTGKQMFFEVSFDRVWHHIELVFFAVLAVCGGFLGAATSRMNLAWTRWRRDSLYKTMPPIAQVGALSFMSAVLCSTDLLKRPHEQLLRDLFQECKIYHTDGLCDADRASLVWSLLYCLLVSFVLTVCTYGIAVPAGIILPVLLTGGIFGRIFGIGMQHFANSWDAILSTSFCPAETQCITPGVYALVGATAVLTGATKLTVASVVLVFEMTGALSYVVPIMIGAMLAKWVSDGLGVPSIYEQWVVLEGYPPASSKRLMPNLRGLDVMKPVQQLHVARLSDSTAQLRKLLKRNVYGFPVINESNQLVGFISHARLGHVLPLDEMEPLDLEQILDSADLYYLSSQVSLSMLRDYMQLGMHTLLFVDKSELQGLITQADLVRTLNGKQGPPLLHREISYRQSLDRELPEL